MNSATDNDRYLQIIRRHSRPLEPIPTSLPPRLRPCPTVRAVLFDIYGTLLISGSGDIGTAAAPESQDRESALRAALHAVGIVVANSGRLADRFESVVRDHQARRAAEGIEHPEVDIVAVWREFVAAGLQSAALRLENNTTVDWLALALEYEMRVNPVWPMPGATSMLQQLSEAGLALGVISNAQSFTPLLFPALTGRTLPQWGVPESRCFYSYRFGEAKPSVRLYRAAADALAQDGIAATETLYVGNDMLNDIWPASRVAFHTGLFAGDARSLRLREGDSRVAALQPDLVVTDWQAFVPVVLSAAGKADYEDCGD